MEYKSFGFGILITLLALGGLGSSSAQLTGQSTLLTTVHFQDPNNSSRFMDCMAYDNTDATKSILCTMSDAVGSILFTRFIDGYQNTSSDGEPNPEGALHYAIRTGPGAYYAGEYRAQLIEEWEASKPIGIE